MHYTLVDGVQRHNEHPDTFEVPSEEEKAAIKLGDFVKLDFEPVIADGDEESGGERMWLEVTKIDGDKFAGKLANHPFIFAGILRINMLIEFEKKHIIGFEEKEDRTGQMYINPPHMTKEEWLHDNANLVMPVGAAPDMRKHGTMIAICLVDNGTHSAAGVAYNDREFERMTNQDGRARVWFFAETEKLLQVVPELAKVIAN